MKMFSMFILSIAFLTSCQHDSRESDIFNYDAEDYILFISDEENLDKEGNYYDALLELKKIYPSDLLELKVVSIKEFENDSSLNISTFPTLLVIKNKTVIKQINGDPETDEIIISIENALKK
ncbi:hypothetical protein [Bacillus sp. PS06]|uniref:hypothetical protein n=1 Tax=Bacillus sp. PS06 TaxID=2764176 RepID=UPI0017876F1A|nr:hypothetical protein [Bacillus sp. PS06]MBD8068460.1 hypothetical protein [Bacillus sp. PS06]